MLTAYFIIGLTKQRTQLRYQIEQPRFQHARVELVNNNKQQTEKKTMRVDLIDSMSLPKGVPVAQYQKLDEALTDVKKTKLQPGTTPEDVVVGVLNKYARQKDCLVDFRDWLWTTIKARTGWTGYKTEQVKQGDKMVTVEAEPEQKSINRFVAQLVDGSFTHKDFNLTGITNEEQREAAVWAVFQAWTDAASKTIDKYNDKGDLVGTEPLPAGQLSRWQVDISIPERKSKPKTPPEYATKNAESVWSDTDKTGKPKAKSLKDRLQGWFDTFTKKGFDFPDFRDTTNPEAAKVNLAWAIKADSDWEREQREKANPYK